MNAIDIVLINVISYMGGFLTGLAFCFKYKKHFLLRTSSHEQLSQIINSIHSEIGGTTNMGPPNLPVIASSIYPSAPQPSAPQPSAPQLESVKEIVIRT